MFGYPVRETRQGRIVAPALDAARFFTEMAALMQACVPDRAALNALGEIWGVEFLGTPLNPRDQPSG
jgi:hypothetical protein